MSDRLGLLMMKPHISQLDSEMNPARRLKTALQIGYMFIRYEVKPAKMTW